MPRLTKTRLTTDLCRTLPPGDHSDAEVRGLSLRVTAAGSRIFALRYRDAEKKQRRVKLGKFGELTLTEARARARDLLGSVAKGDDPAADRDRLRAEESVSELVSRYLAGRVTSKKIKATTAETYAFLLRDYIAPHLGDRKVSAVTRRDVAEAYKRMAQRSESRAILAIRLLRATYSEAKLEGLVASNPAEKQALAPIRKVERYLTAEERGRLWAALDAASSQTRINDAALDAIKLLALCGARKSSITKLKWSEVDLERSMILKNEDSEDTKGTRRILLAPPAVELLRRRMETRTSLHWVFPASKDPGQPATYLDGVWRKIKKMAGIENLRLHDLRHSFASDGLAAGLSLQVIGSLLGHKSTSTTARYAHLCEDAARAALDRVSQRIEEGNKTHRDNVIDMKKKTS